MSAMTDGWQFLTLPGKALRVVEHTATGVRGTYVSKHALGTPESIDEAREQAAAVASFYGIAPQADDMTS